MRKTWLCQNVLFGQAKRLLSTLSRQVQSPAASPIKSSLEHRLTDTQKQTLQQTGFLVFDGLISGQKLQRYKKSFDELVDKSKTMTASHWNSAGYNMATDEQGRPIPGRLHKIQGLFTLESQFLPLARETVIGDKVESILDNPNIDCFGTKFFPMYPGGNTVSWHQDNHYFGTDSSKIVSCAIYLEKTDKENGCLRVIPGTHISQTISPHQPGVGEWANGEWVKVDETKAVDIECSAGTVVLFSALLLHGARQNISQHRTRYSCFWHYIPAELDFTWRGIKFSRGVYQDRHLIRGQ